MRTKACAIHLRRFLFVVLVITGLVSCEKAVSPVVTERVKQLMPDFVDGKRKLVTRDYVLVKPTTIVGVLAKPMNWPATLPWRPQRHFGPFREGSELDRIQVIVHRLGASWYYNDFFTTTDPSENAVFKIYFRPDYSAPLSTALLPSTGTPSTTTPAMAHRPGDVNSGTDLADGFANNILFSLRQIAYSSKFGGSIALHFELADVPTPNTGSRTDDFEYEFRKNTPNGDYRFDFRRIAMTIYINVKAEDINPRGNKPHIFQDYGGVEFVTQGGTAYRDGLIIPFSEAEDILRSTLTSVANGVTSSLVSTGTRPKASLFAHAWLHNQHVGRIELNDKVTKVFISDGWSDVVTEQYKPYVYASWRVHSIFEEGGGFIDELDDEFEVEVQVFHFFDGQNGSRPVSTYTFDKIKEIDDTSSWITIGGWSPEEIQSLNHVELRVLVKELDPISDDVYDMMVINYTLDKASIGSQAALPIFTGPVYAGILDGTATTFEENGIVRGSEGLTENGESTGPLSDLDWEAVVGIAAR